MSTHKRHFGRLMRPGEGRTELGEVDTATDVQIAGRVYYSLEPLSGRELEVARQNFPTASHRVRLYVDRKWQLRPVDYIVPADGTQRLEIVHVQFAEGVELEAQLLVSQWNE